MLCPSCDRSEDKVIFSAKAENNHKNAPNWFTAFTEHYPSCIVRRRRCKTCGHRYYTLELPVKDFKYLGDPAQVKELPLKDK